MRIAYLLAAGAALIALEPARAQFGGRKDESVLYLLTTKGAGTFRTTTDLNAGGAARLQVIDPATLPYAPFSPDFAAKRVKVLHREADDLFQYVNQVESVTTPRAKNLITSKALFLSGLLSDSNRGSISLRPLDVTGALYVPFLKGIATGPDTSLNGSEYLLWTPSSTVPAFVQVPLETPSEIGSAGTTGIEFQAINGAAPFFIPWANLRVRYKADPWPAGLDIKVVDVDRALGNVTQIMRFRPGKRSPPFRIDGNTHIFVLEGSVEIGGGAIAPVTLRTGWYAFAPSGLPLSISSPRPNVSTTAAAATEE